MQVDSSPCALVLENERGVSQQCFTAKGGNVSSSYLTKVLIRLFKRFEECYMSKTVFGGIINTIKLC